MGHILRLCTERDLLVYYTRDSRGSPPGFPDLTIAGPSGQIFAEIKGAGGKLSNSQRRWARRLSEGHAEYHIWGEAALRSGRIAAALDRIADIHLEEAA